MIRDPLIALAIAVVAILLLIKPAFWQQQHMPADRERVVFWHFWGGEERLIVRQIVQRSTHHKIDTGSKRFPFRARTLI